MLMPQCTLLDEQRFITTELDRYADLFDRLEEIITPERAFDIFKRIADTYAPTLTVRYTRGPVVAALLEEAKSLGMCGGSMTFHHNYLGTGNVAVELGLEPRKPVWSMAHLDIISFLTWEREGRRYRLTPYCEPRPADGAREALALAFSPDSGTLKEIAHGWLHTTDGGQAFYFETDVLDLPPATRVVYASAAEWDRESGLVYGAVDDAFGCAALVLSAVVLSHYPVEALIVLTDEEEGVVGVGNQAFARGSARLLNRIASEMLPDLITIADMHEEVAGLASGHLNTARFGQGALFAGLASNTRGGVTPPQLLSFQRELAQYLAGRGIQLQENAGYVSRSDCVSAMMATPNVALVGYPGAYSHFADTPRAHLDDLVHLAKVMVVYLLLAQSPTWRERYLLP